MRFKVILIILFILFFEREFTFAQEYPVNKRPDSAQPFTVNSKFSRFMYRLLFKPASGSSGRKAKKKSSRKLLQKSYSSFEGKTIRNINIETLDPFGYSIGDTIDASLNIVTKNGNKLHIKTQQSAIRNLLRIRPNQRFDSLLVKESERLVRKQKYVTDVSFYVVATSKKSDSVDVFIRELDNWSIIPEIASSSSGTTVILTDKNFLGLGHEFQNKWTRNPTGNAFNTSYSLPNISNTYIGAVAQYGFEGRSNSYKSLSIERPFFSPFTQWAGGIDIAQQRGEDSTGMFQPDFQEYRLNIQDFWIGNAIQLLKGNTPYSRTTKLISSFRVSRIRYPEKPFESQDTQKYSGEDFYLAGIGLSRRNYVQDKFIFNFGMTEDVPVGKVYAITGGYQHSGDIGRLYLGSRVSVGNYYPWGYFSANGEYGTFFRSSHAEQGTFSAGAIYFTGLVEIGKWKFRQFAKTQLTVGVNRFDRDSLTLNDGFGLNGFNSKALTGRSRLLFTLQTQSYAPWNFIGFRFGPYFTYALGMLGDEDTGFKNKRVYSQIGVGVLIKNINLVINTFRISFAFYPSIPGIGQDIFKINSFNNSDFGLTDFEIGKPSIVMFR